MVQLTHPLMTLSREYSKRFGHPVPQFAHEKLSAEKLVQVLQQALREDTPVEEWKRFQRDPHVDE